MKDYHKEIPVPLMKDIYRPTIQIPQFIIPQVPVNGLEFQSIDRMSAIYPVTPTVYFNKTQQQQQLVNNENKNIDIISSNDDNKKEEIAKIDKTKTNKRKQKINKQSNKKQKTEELKIISYGTKNYIYYKTINDLNNPFDGIKYFLDELEEYKINFDDSVINRFKYIPDNKYNDNKSEKETTDVEKIIEKNDKDGFEATSSIEVRFPKNNKFN